MGGLTYCSTHEIDVTVNNDLGQWAEDDDLVDDGQRAHLYGEYKDEDPDNGSMVYPRVGRQDTTAASWLLGDRQPRLRAQGQGPLAWRLY